MLEEEDGFREEGVGADWLDVEPFSLDELVVTTGWLEDVKVFMPDELVEAGMLEVDEPDEVEVREDEEDARTLDEPEKLIELGDVETRLLEDEELVDTGDVEDAETLARLDEEVVGAEDADALLLELLAGRDLLDELEAI